MEREWFIITWTFWIATKGKRWKIARIAVCRKVMLTLTQLLAPYDKPLLSNYKGPRILDTIRLRNLCIDSHRCFSQMGLVLMSFSIPTVDTHFHLFHSNNVRLRCIYQRRCNTPTDERYRWIHPHYNDMNIGLHIRSIQLHQFHLDNRNNCHRFYFDEVYQRMNNSFRRYHLRSWPYRHKLLQLWCNVVAMNIEILQVDNVSMCLDWEGNYRTG